MALIRKNVSAAIVYSMADIEDQAASLLEEARAQASEIVRQANNKTKGILEAAVRQGKMQGFTQGFDAGKKEGRESGRKEALDEMRQNLRDLSELMQSATSQIEGYLQLIQAQVPRDVMILALEIARRTARIAGRHDPETLRYTVESAVKLLLSKSRARIAIHPQQHQLMAEIMQDMHMDVPQFENAQIVSDERIAPGGCRITCGEGEVDADLDKQIDRIAAEILPELAQLDSAPTIPTNDIESPLTHPSESEAA